MESLFKKSIGSDDSMAQVLTPMGKKMSMIMPYAQPDGSSSLIFGQLTPGNLMKISLGAPN